MAEETNCEVIVQRFLGDVPVGEGYRVAVAHSEVDVWDAIGDFFESFFGGVLSIVTTSQWMFLLAKVVAWAPATALLALAAASKVNEETTAIANDLLSCSNRACSAEQELVLEESDDFDRLLISYHAWGDDDFKRMRWIYLPPGTYSGGESRESGSNILHHYWINITDLREGGIYPFVFGAVDSGFKYDVAVFSKLILRWVKKPMPICGALSQLHGCIDPPDPRRSFRNLANILGARSLRGCVAEMANCRSIQASPLKIYWQNVALLSSSQFKITLKDIVNIDPFPLPGSEETVFALDLYAGRSRERAIDAFVAYLQLEQPDVVGFCEFWMPEERAAVRDRLRSVYPYAELAPSTFFLQGPLGPAPGLTLADGGLMLLSKYPIMHSFEHVFQSAFGEDGFSAKGILYAGIAVPGFPTLLHVFVTHLQSCPTAMEDTLGESAVKLIADFGDGWDCEDKQFPCQIRELKEFVQAHAPLGPCIIMGDFNIPQVLDPSRVPPQPYDALRLELAGYGDAWADGLAEADYGAEFYWPNLTTPFYLRHSAGKTQGGNCSFSKGSNVMKWDAFTASGTERYYLDKGSRIDFMFSYPSSTAIVNPGLGGSAHLHFGRRRTVHVMLDETGAQASDHAGLLVTVDSIRVRAA